MDDAKSALVERAAISDLLVRYTISLDGRDWEGLRTCFTADAVADFGALAGVKRGREAIVEFCRRSLSELDGTHHLIGNFVIEVDGRNAVTQCYLHAQHLLVSPQGVDTFVVGGMYRDHLVRTAEGWRIAHRSLETTWTDGNAGIFAEAAARRRHHQGERPAAPAG